MMATAGERLISIPFEDAQRIFDLAVNADSACSGWMESDDVDSMRKLGAALGIKDDVWMGREFLARRPHDFKAGPRGCLVCGLPVSWGLHQGRA